MRFLDVLRARFRALTRGGAVDRELDDEMRDHVQHLVEEHLARGLSPEDARRAALREFGPVTQLAEEARDARGISLLTTIAADLKYGARLARRSPGFAAVTILTVALGIGATTAMYSIVYGVLLRPLPYGDADRLVSLCTAAPRRGLPCAYVAMANVYDWRARNHVFEDIASMRVIANFNLIGQGEPERLFAARVSSNLFPLLRVSPMLGRAFTEEEDEIGHETVAILTYGLWQRRFGGDPSVIGRTISLSGTPHTVVGVMGPDFAYPTRDYQIYTPLTFDPKELITRLNYSYSAVARLKPGVTLEAARTEMNAIAAQIEREHPKENEGIGVAMTPLLDDTVGRVRTPLRVLLGAVVVMLLIGCANLANLLLSRALARDRELAVRAALGASRARLVMQSVCELVPMLTVGGILGLGGAALSVEAIVPLLPADMPRLESISLSVPVLISAALTLIALAAFIGVWPAIEASRHGLAPSVGELARGSTAGPRRARMRDLLVVGQIAATLWLAIGATLMTRSLAAISRVSPGFNPERVYSALVAVPRTKYPRDVDVAAFYARLLERVEAAPDVEAAAMVNRLPLGGVAQTAPIEFDGEDQAAAAADVQPQADLRSITPDYFHAMQIPLLSGRGFADSDGPDAPLVGVIDERIARTYFKDRNPLGRRFRPAVPGQPWTTIVGVVGHIHHDRLDDDGRPQVYWSYRQNTQDRMAIVVRTRTSADAFGRSLAAAVRSVDPDQPIYDARPLEAVVDRALAQQRLQTTILSSFAALALGIAGIGVYGVVAFAVGQRRREFAIRLALGARRSEIVGLVLRRGALLFAAGAAIGVVAAGVTGQAIGSLLYGVPRFDTLSFAAATAVLLTVAFAACLLPARRAAIVDPSVTLRAE